MSFKLVRNLAVLTVLALVFAYVVLQTVTTCPNGIKTATQQYTECN